MPDDNISCPPDRPACPFSRISAFMADARLTITLLALAILLLFFATLSGAAYGIELTASAYFGSLLAIWQYPSEWPAGEILSHFWLPLPGGPLIAFFAIWNVIFAAGANVKKWTNTGMEGAGSLVTHAGIAIVLAGYAILLFASSKIATITVVAGGSVAIAGIAACFCKELTAFFKCTGKTNDSDDTTGLRLNRSWYFAPMVGIVAGAGAYFFYGADGLARMYVDTDLELMPLVLYAFALLTICIFWIKGSSGNDLNRRIAFPLLTSAVALHTILPVCLTLIRMRPPVTDLHSSIVTAGWAGALFSYYVERHRRDGIAGLASVVIGFATLLTAYFPGDENILSPLSPAIDSPLWLTLHVFIITIAYGFALTATVVADIYLIRLIFKRNKDIGTPVAIVRTTLAAALVTAIAGTICGGLWAERAWGRFWGWDPKENAALMLILWCVLALHYLKAGAATGTGFVKLGAATGIVLAWSWAGTNLLGSGLHSYGFTQGGAMLLGVYVLLQLLVLLSRAPKAK
jgi:ABC-type transport system involved in cytochrome c biogenesis permease subunit